MDDPAQVYLGVDLSTQSLTAVFLEARTRKLVHVDSINYDQDLPYNTKNGMHINPRCGRVISPVAMWLDAVDTLLRRQPKELMGRVVAVSGSAQQHGSVYWTAEGVHALPMMDPAAGLKENLDGAFTLEDCPIWADSSTQAECDMMEAAAGGPAVVSRLTGSRCYCRFTGPQIAKVSRCNDTTYQRTERITLVSAFLSSLLLGQLAPTDAADASGMNLMDLWSHDWNEEMLGATRARDLRHKLGKIVEPFEVLGPVSPYVSTRYGLRSDCVVIPVSGDNPCSIVGMGLALHMSDEPLSPISPRADHGVEDGDIVVSLGTSDTLLGLTRRPRPRTEGHVMVSPRCPGEYFVMLCYKNGSIAREMVRDQFCGGDWDTFTKLLSQSRPGNNGRLGMYLVLEEIMPLLPLRGVFRVDDQGQKVNEPFDPAGEVRAVVEARFLSMKAHAVDMGISKPSRILATGGGSQNKEMMQVLADVFGCPVEAYHDTTDSAAVGAALRAEQGYLSRKTATFVEPSTSGLTSKLVASPSPNAVGVYTDALLKRFIAFEASLASTA